MERKNTGMFIIAMIIFGSIGIFVKNIELSSSVIVLWRTYIGTLFIAFVFLIRRIPFNIQGIKKNILPLLLAGIVLGGGWVFLFEAYQYLSVSMATLLYYSAPILVFFLSVFLFKEKITKHKLFGITLALIGMMIINVVGTQEVSLFGIGCGLLSAVLYAMLMILNKYIKGLSGLESTLIQLFVAAIVMSFYVYFTTGSLIHLPLPEDIFYVVFIGVVHTGIACYCYFCSMQTLSGQSIAILSYLDPACALLFSFIILQERLSILQIIGGACILGGIIYKQMHEKDD